MKKLAIAVLLSVTASAAAANPTVDVVTSIGAVKAAENGGMTLYTFRKDRRGRSNCSGACAKSWPPFLANGTAANDGSTIIKRPDGTLQWATPAGMPLYFWIGDTAPGETTGDGVGGVWDAVRR